MGTIFFLILFALVVALLLLILKSDPVRDIIVKLGAIVLAAVSIFVAARYFNHPTTFTVSPELASGLGTFMLVAEVCLAVVIIVLGIKHKKYLASLLSIIQTPIMVWFELSKGHHIEVAHDMYIDNLSAIMILIIGIVGSLICVYATAYMKDFQHHQPEGSRDRRPWFFFVMFVFLGAMYGIVTSDNLVWMYFYWEITTLASFFLIGFTKTPEAVKNSFLALILNLIGGLGFVGAIVYMGFQFESLELSFLIEAGMGGYGIFVAIPVACLAFASLVKAAQMPFNGWLLGAMVAPTPTSALLHSSTMVKAGVFLILKLAPCLGWNAPGLMVMMVGGITFLLASFAAISQSNGKRILAYSTVANLGLIVVCGGIGTYAAVWAGMMLLIFHAITKSLLFLCVGTAEHNIGSRDVEDMDGLFGRLPRLAAFMIVGICAMFLAPLGMLISKWASMVAFIDSGNLILVAIICFGSAATAFYWTKWLGKLTAVVANRENIQANIHKEEWVVLGTLVTLAVLVCLVFPIVSSVIIVPYLQTIFSGTAALALSSGNMYIMTCMLALLIILPLLFFGRTSKKIVPIYMAGVNKGDDLTFENSLKGETAVSLRNWYMTGIFNEKMLNLVGGALCLLMIAYDFVQIIGGVL